MNATLSASEPLSSYTAEYTAIAALGVRGAQTAAPWNSLNPTGTTYDLTMITNPFFGLDRLAELGFTTIFLNIPVVALTQRTMPADIAVLAFNDPVVKARLRALIDRILPTLNSAVVYVALGNEVDSYFATHGAEWPQFVELVEDARGYVRAARPDVRVGVTTTFDGATATQRAAVATLNAASEEFQFRSVLLAHLRGVFRPLEMALLTAVFFGLGHYYGQPSGPLGVLMAGFAGWIWARSMIETRGGVWAFLIHFVQDIVIFAFLAVGAGM